MYDINWEQGQEQPLKRRDELDAIAEALADDAEECFSWHLQGLPDNESDYVKSRVLELL